MVPVAASLFAVMLFCDEWRSADRLYALGQYHVALARYEAWVPNSGCGNCNAAMSDHRAYGIACCRLKLGHPTAAANTLMAEMDDNWMGARWCGQRLFELYREADRLDVLSRMVAGREAARVPRLLLAITQLAELGESAALVAICRDCNCYHADITETHTTSWRSRAAAEALATLQSTGASAAGEAALIRGPQAGAVSWLIYSLGCNPSPAAYRYLEVLFEREQSWDRQNVVAAMDAWRRAEKKRGERDAAAAAVGGVFVPQPLRISGLPTQWASNPTSRRQGRLW